MIKDIDQLIDGLFADLNPRQVKVVTGRFGLKSGEKTTLQEIGDELGITRERVRQIEEYCIKKLEKRVKEEIQEFLEFCHAYLTKAGGVRRDDYFIDDIKYFIKPGLDKKVKNADQKIRFLLWTGGMPSYHKEDEKFRSFWYSDEESKRKFLDFIKSVTNLLEKNDKQAVLDDKIYLKHCKDFYTCHYVLIPNHFGCNVFGDFGLREWPEIEPKTIRDKIYLVLKKHGKPLHFEQIAKFITDFGIDNKPAHVQTAHNDLINDERFVLVGRGVYGLKERGFVPGTVREVITRLLKANGPLTKAEIVNLVNKERFLQENTILINLQNKRYFKKLADGLYHLR